MGAIYRIKCICDRSSRSQWIKRANAVTASRCIRRGRIRSVWSSEDFLCGAGLVLRAIGHTRGCPGRVDRIQNGVPPRKEASRLGQPYKAPPCIATRARICSAAFGNTPSHAAYHQLSSLPLPRIPFLPFSDNVVRTCIPLGLVKTPTDTPAQDSAAPTHSSLCA